jgi:hypothetical protein
VLWRDGNDLMTRENTIVNMAECFSRSDKRLRWLGMAFDQRLIALRNERAVASPAFLIPAESILRSVQYFVLIVNPHSGNPLWLQVWSF